MKDNFELIVHKMDRNMEFMNIYPIPEPHIGSPQFDKYLFDAWLNVVKQDENGYITLGGDLFDNALKGSKSNSYKATMSPREQKDWLVDRLTPLKNRVLSAVQGNHEARSEVVADDCPLYDAMSKLDIEDMYREDICFLKISLGTKRQDRQYSYGIVLVHGGSVNKIQNFSYSIDNCDVFISGHTHSGDSTFPAKYVIDMQNEVVRKQGFKRIVVPSCQNGGGYVIKGLYMPQDNEVYPIIRLDGMKKSVEVNWRNLR